MNINNETGKYLVRYYEILEDMINGMTQAYLTNSVSHNFIVQMLPHHIAAIEMSQNVLKYTDMPKLKRIALNIITAQTKSIKAMLRAMPRCSMTVNSYSDAQEYENTVNQILSAMFSEMANAYTDNNISADFMREMIPHHRGAVRLSENALRYNICSELVPILNTIITLQEQGIEEMNGLLNEIE